MMILKLMQTFASWQHKDNHKQTRNHIQNAFSLKPNFKSRNIDGRLFDFHHILSPKGSLHNNKKLELLNVLQTQIGRHLGSKTLVTRSLGRAISTPVPHSFQPSQRKWKTTERDRKEQNQ